MTPAFAVEHVAAVLRLCMHTGALRIINFGDSPRREPPAALHPPTLLPLALPGSVTLAFAVEHVAAALHAYGRAPVGPAVVDE